MAQKTFTVLGSNPSNQGKTFVWKLQVIEEVNCFGINKAVKRTYYIGGMPSEIAVGTEIKEDLNKFEIVEREFITKDGNKIMLKWLHAKVA